MVHVKDGIIVIDQPLFGRYLSTFLSGKFPAEGYPPKR
jgi:hypothetical protein